MKKSYLFLLLFFGFSCSDSEQDNQFDQQNTNLSTITTRSAGDGENDLLGYGYNCLYALANNYKGAMNRVIDIQRYESGEGVNPSTGASVVMPKGTVEIALSHGDFTQYEQYGSSLSSFYGETSSNITVNTGTLIPWGKLEFTSEFDNKISEKKQYSFYRADLCVNTKRLYFNSYNIKRLKYSLTDDFIFALKNYTAKEIVDDYGTHVLTDIYVGGKLSVLASAYEVDKSKEELKKVTGDILSYVKGGLKDSISTTNDLVNLSLHLIQHGGSFIQTSKVITNANGTISTDIFDWNTWSNSVDEKHSTLIHSNLERMIPIWEFVEDATLKQAVIDEIKKRSVPAQSAFNILSVPSFILTRKNATQKGYWDTRNYKAIRNLITLDRNSSWKLTTSNTAIKQYVINNNKYLKSAPGIIDFSPVTGEETVAVSGSSIYVELGKDQTTNISYDYNYPKKGKSYTTSYFTNPISENLEITDVVSGVTKKIPILIYFE